MISRHASLAIFAFMLFAAVVCSAATVDIGGSLTGPDGQPIKDALVVLIDIAHNGPESNSHQWAMRTGSDGRFSLTVPVACYDAFVTAVQFDPHAQRICLSYDSKPFLKIKMKIAKDAWLYIE